MPSASGITAGHAYVLIEAMDKTGAAFASVGKRLNRLGTEIAQVGMRMTMMGATMALPFVDAIRHATKFDYAMRSVRAAMAINNEEAKKLEKTIRHLGSTTSFNPVEIAQAAENLGRAGLNVAEVQKVLLPVMALARAGNTDIAETGKIIVRVMRAFGLSAGEAERIADKLFVAARNGTADLGELIQALSYAGGTIAQMGGSIDSALAVLPAFADHMLYGTKAGTSFNMMLSRLVANADKVRELLGFDVMNKAGQVRPMVELFALMASSLNKMPSGQRLQVLTELFNIRGARGGAALVGSFRQILDLLEKLKQSGGASLAAFREKDSGIWGDIKKITSALDDLRISVGSSFKSVFAGMKESIIPVINQLSEFAKTHERLVRNVGLGIVVFTAFGAVLTAVGLGLAGIGVALSNLSGMIGAVAAIFTPAGAAIAVAIAGIVVSIKYFIDLSKAIVSKAGGAWKRFTGSMQAWFKIIYNAGKELFTAFSEMWSASVDLFSEVLKPLGVVLLDIGKAMLYVSAVGFLAFLKTLTFVLRTLTAVLKMATNAVKTLFEYINNMAGWKHAASGLAGFFDFLTAGFGKAAAQAAKLDAKIADLQLRLKEKETHQKFKKADTSGVTSPNPKADVGGTSSRTVAQKRAELVQEIKDKKRALLMDMQEQKLKEAEDKQRRERELRSRQQQIQDIYQLEAEKRRTIDVEKRRELDQEIANRKRALRRSLEDERLANARAELERRRRALETERKIAEIHAKERKLGAAVPVAVPGLPAVAKGPTAAALSDPRRNRAAKLLADRIEALKKSLEESKKVTADLPDALQYGTVAAFQAEYRNRINQQIATNTKLIARRIDVLTRRMTALLSPI